jgi:hypothetical protein
MNSGSRAQHRQNDLRLRARQSAKNSIRRCHREMQSTRYAVVEKSTAQASEVPGRRPPS